MRRRFGLLSLALLLATFAGFTTANAEPAVEVGQAWSRASTPNAKIGIVYLTIKAHAKSGDRLLSVTSLAAKQVEIHTHIKDGDIMRMRRVESVELPKGGKLVFAPGSYHLMLIGLKQPLMVDDELPVTLTFEHAGQITVLVRVRQLGAAGPSPRGSHS